MTVYTATIRGYVIGCDQEWEWEEVLPSGIGPGEYQGEYVPTVGAHGERPSGSDLASSNVLSFDLGHQTYGADRAAEAERAAFRLRAAFAPEQGSGLIEMTVELASGSYVVRGRPVAPLTDLSYAYAGQASARVGFRTLDPLWYGAPHSATADMPVASGGMATPMVTPMVTTGGGVTGDATVTNLGTAPADWSLSITGPTVDPRLTLAGKTIFVVGTIPAGSVFTLDSRSRLPLLDGSVRPWVSYTSDWWKIPAGASTFSFRASSGSGRATLSWRDASF